MNYFLTLTLLYILLPNNVYSIRRYQSSIENDKIKTLLNPLTVKEDNVPSESESELNLSSNRNLYNKTSSERKFSTPQYSSYEVTSLRGLNNEDFPTKHYAGHVPITEGGEQLC